MLDGDEKSVRLPAGPAASRRRWSEAEKRRIVAESYQSGVSVSVVARRNDVNANLVFNWRRQFREAGGFVPVVVEPDRLLPPPPDAGSGAVPATGRIEIALADVIAPIPRSYPAYRYMRDADGNGMVCE